MMMWNACIESFIHPEVGWQIIEILARGFGQSLLSLTVLEINNFLVDLSLLETGIGVDR